MIVVPNFEAQAVKSFLTGFDVSKFSADPVTRVCKYADAVKSYAVPGLQVSEDIHFQSGSAEDVSFGAYCHVLTEDLQPMLDEYIEVKNSPTRFFAVFVFPSESSALCHFTILEIQQEEVKDFETQVLALNEFVAVS